MKSETGMDSVNSVNSVNYNFSIVYCLHLTVTPLHPSIISIEKYSHFISDFRDNRLSTDFSFAFEVSFIRYLFEKKKVINCYYVSVKSEETIRKKPIQQNVNSTCVRHYKIWRMSFLQDPPVIYLSF